MSEERQVAAWLAAGIALYLVMGLLGRATIPDGEVLSLVWPAAGVATLMFGLVSRACGGSSRSWSRPPPRLQHAHRRERVPGCGVRRLQRGAGARRRAPPPGTGAPPDRRRGRDPLERLQDFWAVLASCLVASLVGAVVGSVGRGLLGDWTGLDGLVWWGRNATGDLAIFTTGILAVAAWRRLRRPGERPSCVRARDRATEMLLIVAVTLLLYLAFFLGDDWLPVAFPLLVPTVWVGAPVQPDERGVAQPGGQRHGGGVHVDGRRAVRGMDSWAQEVLRLPAVRRHGLLPRHPAGAQPRGAARTDPHPVDRPGSGPEPGRADVDHHRLDARRGVRWSTSAARWSGATRPVRRWCGLEPTRSTTFASPGSR